MKLREYLSNTLVPKLFICLKENYNCVMLKKDIIAGLTVAIISIPLAMALAISSGVTPEVGLITAIVAGFIVSCLGGSRFQIGGPTAAFIAVVYNIINKHGSEALIIITFIAGIILIISGLFRIGFLIKYIPNSIITGFTSGLAVIIFFSQIKYVLGLNNNDFNINTIIISVIAIFLILIIRKNWPKLPSFFLAVAGITVLVIIFKINIPTIGTQFLVTVSSLPQPKLPLYSCSLGGILILLPDIFTVALLAGIESLLSAIIADRIAVTRHNSNVELIAQGLANICSACFGGLPATGAIARTVTNIKAGGKTPIAGIISALLILIFIKFFATITNLIPLSCLAAVLIIIAWDMGDLKSFRYFLLSSNRIDSVVVAVTFLLTIFTDLVIAIPVGLLINWILHKANRVLARVLA